MWRAHRRLTSELLLVAVPYTVAVAGHQMWWGGHSSPVRFIVPVLLPFGLAAAAQWARSRSPGRGTFSVLLGASVALAVALAWVDRGALVYNVRDGFALWMDRAAPLVNLPRAVPSLFRNTAVVTAMQAAMWAAAGIVSWLVCREALSACGSVIMWRSCRRSTMHLWLALACTVTIGATLGWRVAGAASLERGTGLSGVARAAAVRGTVLRLPAIRREPAARLLPTYRCPLRCVVTRGRPSACCSLGATFRPARYRVLAHGPAALSGTIEATVGRRVGAVSADGARQRAARRHADAARFARRRAGADHRTATVLRHAPFTGVAADPGVQQPDQPPTVARRAMRYGDVLVWFLDEGAWAEAEGWWVGGGASAAVVIERTSVNARRGLLVRNGGAKNRIALTAGRWSTTLDLAPGEERPVDPPLLRVGCPFA